MDKIQKIENVQKKIEKLFHKTDESCIDIMEIVTFYFLNNNIIKHHKRYDNLIYALKLLDETEVKKIYKFVLAKVNNPELEIRCLLFCLPDDKTSAFTEKINYYLNEKKSIDEDILNRIIEDENNNKMIRFKAFYILFTYNHHQKNASKCKQLVDNYKYKFESFPLWHYVNSQIGYQEEKNKVNPDLSLTLESAMKCIEIYENNKQYDSSYPGIYHNFSELVFYASELGNINLFQKNFEKAIECIEKAKRYNPNYGKYYYTQGRLLMAQCKYDESLNINNIYDKAEKLFEKAIDIEDSSNDNYSIKIIDYETALLRCKTERHLKEVDIALKDAKKNQESSLILQRKTEKLMQDSRKIKEEVELQKRETLELLGFFSGIISLIVVTSQVVLNLDMLSATVIMLLFLGTLILAFSFFHLIILNGKEKMTKGIIAFLIFGIILIIVAIVMAFFSRIFK